MSVAFVFPGQGSQSVGMMTAYGDNAVIRDTFAEASEALGEDLWQMAEQGPAESLALTVNTQPLMLAAGVAVFRAWRHAGGESPDVVAGHSLGEYSALVAAGVLRFADAVPLVRFRAQAMQQAVPAGKGGMAALLGLQPDVVDEVCREAAEGEVVSAANLNAPGQIVIAGASAALDRAIDIAKQRGAKRAMKLPVSAPFHCEMMRPAAEQLADRLAQVSISTPEIPVINNVDVVIENEPEAIRDALIRQAYSPVRWIEIVQTIADRGVGRILESGPGKVLTGMSKRSAGSASCEAIHDAASLEQALAAGRA